MALRKHYQHADSREFFPSRRLLILGMVLGAGLASAMYALMYYFREILRVLWSDPVYGDFMILSHGEVDFYNTVSAFTAVLFGQGVAFTCWFNRSRRKFGRLGRRIECIVSDLWPLNLFFFWMLVQTVVVAGTAFFWRPQYEFGLYPDFNIYFVLMLVVLFLQQWVGIVRLFRRRAMKWMCVSAVVVSAAAFALSRINFIDYDAFNERMQRKNIYANYHIDWPVAAYTDHPDFRTQAYIPDGNIYVAGPKQAAAGMAPTVVMNNLICYSDPALNDISFREVSPDSVGAVVKRWQEYKLRDTVYHAYPGRCIYRLKINRNIPMSVVGKLKTDLAAAGVGTVEFAVQPPEYGPGESFRSYDDRLMLTMPLPPYYAYTPERLAEAFAESGRRYGPSFDIVESGNGICLLDGEPVRKTALKDAIKALVADNPDCLFRYHIDDDAVFQDYIDVMVSGLQAVHELRKEYAQRHYGLDVPESWEMENAMRRRYPLRILEMTESMNAVLKSDSGLRKPSPADLPE